MTTPSSREPATVLGGPWFEDFELGLEFDAPSITLHEGHAALYGAIFGDRLRLPLDATLARRVAGGERALAHPMLPIQIAVGQSTWASQRVKANLFYRGLTLLAPVRLGDTLHTTTRVVALRQNRSQPGRAATGMVALEMTTRNQNGEMVLHFWRCPMIPCRDPNAATGRQDDLEKLGAGAEHRRALPPLERWRFAPLQDWKGLRAADLVSGRRYALEARDTVTSAPELVRLTLNMAMTHTDARLSYLPERLVYGGHTISLCFAQLTRALPNLLTMLSWQRCDHTAPVLENDVLRTEFSVLEREPAPWGENLRLHAEVFGARGKAEEEARVLDWDLWVASA